jgi:hypothetical protein
MQICCWNLLGKNLWKHIKSTSFRREIFDKIPKTRQKFYEKICEIDWSHLCIRQFDKFFDIWNLCAIKSDSDDCSDNNEHVAVDISDVEVCVVASNSGLAGHTAPEKSVNVLHV